MNWRRSRRANNGARAEKKARRRGHSVSSSWTKQLRDAFEMRSSGFRGILERAISLIRPCLLPGRYFNLLVDRFGANVELTQREREIKPQVAQRTLLR